MLQILADNDIGVDYIYSTIKSKEDEAVVMIKVEDPKKAMEILLANGVKLYDMNELGV